MKTFKKLIVTILVAVVVFGVNIPPVMASNRPVITSNLAIEKLKMEDSGPDLTKGRLILETLGTEPDGTPYRVTIKVNKDNCNNKNFKKPQDCDS